MKKIYFLLLLLSIAVSLNAQEKYQRAVIYYDDLTQRQEIIELAQLDHFNEKKNTAIIAEIPTSIVDELRDNGLQIKIEIEDMQAHIENFQSVTKSQRNTTPCEGNSTAYPVPENYVEGSMGGYYTYQEMENQLALMQQLYPNLITTASPISDFETEEGNSILWVKISDNPTQEEDERKALYSAIHHAREPGSLQQLIYYMWFLLENYDSNQEIQGLINNTELYFIPILNPDGYQHNQTTNPNGGGYWRKNKRNHGDGNYGVDNNRNYGTAWGTTGISTTDTGNDTYCGTTAFSEVENQAMKWFTEQKDFVIALNAHTHGELLLYPLGYDYNLPTPDNDLFIALTDEMVKYNGYNNIISSELYPASGTSDDWMYIETEEKPKMFALTAEVGTSFWDSPQQTLINNKNMLHTNLTALRFVHNYGAINEENGTFIPSSDYTFNYSLQRLGSVNNGTFTVSIEPISPNIESYSNQETFSNLSYGETENGSLQITLSNTIQNGDNVSFNVVLNNGTFTQRFLVEKTYGNLTEIFSDDLESNDHWTREGNWGITSEDAYEGTYAMTDSPNSNYNNNSTSSVTLTQEIDLSNFINAYATFYTRWNIEANYDYVQFEISTDGGSNWIPQCGKLTALGSSLSGEAFNEPIYSGEKSGWTQESINLSDYLGQQIKIRFNLVTDYAEDDSGFYFDAFKIIGISESLGNNNLFKDNTFEIYPNPAKNFVKIKSNKTFNEYTLYATDGKLIKKGSVSNNTIPLQNIPSGVYILSLNDNGKTINQKLIIE